MSSAAFLLFLLNQLAEGNPVRIQQLRSNEFKGNPMNQAVAGRLKTHTDPQGWPDASAWENSPLVAFCSDWRGLNPDPERETCVRLLWSQTHLFCRYRCRYREIFVYEGGNERRDQLWTRDVAELFIRPDTGSTKHYKEFEISPNGNWLDLDIFPDGKSILYCDLKSRVAIDSESRVWTAELAIPFHSLVAEFNPRHRWRLNLFRIEGREPNRFYSAWQPTNTPHPSFHVPEAFGYLNFE